jgi:hypothetical protein
MGDIRHQTVACFTHDSGGKISVLISWVKCSFQGSTVASQAHLTLIGLITYWNKENLLGVNLK